jgi:hypothetical protein
MNTRQLFLIGEETKRVKDALGAFPGSEQRCVTAVARRVLLNGPYFYDGKHINPVGKSIGAGVWAITHKAE